MIKKLHFKKLLLMALMLVGAGSMWASTKTIDAGELTDGVLTDAPFTLTFAKNTGGTAPTYNTSGGDIRVYAKGSVEVACSEGKMTKIVFNLSAQGLKRLAPITASVGTITTQASGDVTVTWTGNAASVTFTVGDKADYGSESDKAGQLCFSSVDITYSAAVKHTATFYVNGSKYSEVSVSENVNIPFPTTAPASTLGKDFKGWVATAINGTTNTEPSYVTSATMGTTDMNFYAVFATPTWNPGNVTLTIDKDTENFPTSYGTANSFAEYTLEGFAFQIQQAYVNGNKLQWRASGHASGTGTMYNSDPINKIQSIVLTYDGDNNKNFSVCIGDEENPADGTSINAEETTGDVRTFDCSSYEKDYFVLTNGTGAGYLASIAITYKGSVKSYTEYCTSITATININEACTDGEGNYYATFSYPFAFVVPEDLTVYEVVCWGGELAMVSYDTGDIVLANNGVLVASTTAGDHDITLSTEEGYHTWLGEEGYNYLKPTGADGISAKAMAAASDEDTKFYRLTMHNGTKIGFWWGADNGAAFELGANKAYLAVPADDAGLAREGFEFGGNATGINNVNANVNENQEVYDLQGRRVAHPTKGLYIVNGKKVLVK